MKKMMLMSMLILLTFTLNVASTSTPTNANEMVLNARGQPLVSEIVNYQTSSVIFENASQIATMSVVKIGKVHPEGNRKIRDVDKGWGIGGIYINKNTDKRNAIHNKTNYLARGSGSLGYFDRV